MLIFAKVPQEPLSNFKQDVFLGPIEWVSRCFLQKKSKWCRIKCLNLLKNKYPLHPAHLSGLTETGINASSALQLQSYSGHCFSEINLYTCKEIRFSCCRAQGYPWNKLYLQKAGKSSMLQPNGGEQSDNLTTTLEAPWHDKPREEIAALLPRVQKSSVKSDKQEEWLKK